MKAKTDSQLNIVLFTITSFKNIQYNLEFFFVS